MNRLERNAHIRSLLIRVKTLESYDWYSRHFCIDDIFKLVNQLFVEIEKISERVDAITSAKAKAEGYPLTKHMEATVGRIKRQMEEYKSQAEFAKDRVATLEAERDAALEQLKSYGGIP